MKTSEHGLRFIQEQELLRLKAYLCSGGVWTIGYGHTGMVDGVLIGPGMIITNEKAKELFRNDIMLFERFLNKQTFADRLTQNQYDALISFMFNVGVGHFQSSTMFRKLQSGESEESIVKEFGRWIYATINGKKAVLPGLVSRRDEEANMFLRK